ncbi:general transcription factor 3C polypeptide 3-like [Rhipicephalus microplus]|uniref:general transcription factor 3C polypeptide 3-like n=1 Tax=Rhipicephalus microplus TaxID=6941 RepID=UPI003F6B3EED
MSDDQRDEYIALTSYLHQGDLLYDDSSSESWVSDETTPQTSEYSDATDTDDDEGQCEMLDSTGTAAETTIDRLVECVDSFLASEDEESEEDDALEENVVENRLHETRNVAKRLPRYLRGLMGEANMCFARGRYEDAVKMCLEIVRLAPTSPLPFQTLAMIYEELRDPNRSLQFGLIAAYLGTQDASEWSRLAQLCLEQGLVRKAALCLIRALRVDPHDLEMRRLLCALYEQLGDEHRALVSCAALARRIEEPDECLQLSRHLVDVFRSRQNLPSAVRVLLDAATKFPAHITAEDIHTLLEMQLTLKMHSAALLVLHDHCGVQLLPLPEGHKAITAELFEDSLDAFERCLVPAELCIDIKTKLVVCVIHLGGRHLVMDLVREMKRELDPEKSGDFSLNVAEAFMEAEFENDALPLLRMLVRTCNYGTAAVWLLYAECLKRLGRHQEATKAYERTCELAPRHAPSRLSLGQLLDAQGLRDQAIDCLATDSRQLQDTKDSTPEQQQDSASVLLCQAWLLWDSGQREAFIESAMTLVRAHCLSVCSAEEYDAVYSNTYHLSRMKVLRELHEKRGFTPGWLTMESGVSVDELQACFLELYRALQETGRMDDLRQVATEVLVAPMFNKDATSTEELEFLSFLAHYQDPDHVEHSFAIIRAMVLKYPDQVRAWNLLGLVANQIPAWRKKGFYLRLLYKHENSLPLGVLVAHNAFLCANYKHALAEYTQLLRHVGKEEPMLLLCSGISLMRLAGQQLTLNQNCPGGRKSAGVQKSPRKFYWLATQGMTFLCRYLRARGSDCQEALFNVGRALHELGYPHMAVNMYQRALAAPPAVQEMPEVFDLRREIAFNLSLLYQRGGNNELADWCINHYCVI